MLLKKLNIPVNIEENNSKSSFNCFNGLLAFIILSICQIGIIIVIAKINHCSKSNNSHRFVIPLKPPVKKLIISVTHVIHVVTK